MVDGGWYGRQQGGSAKEEESGNGENEKLVGIRATKSALALLALPLWTCSFRRGVSISIDPSSIDPSIHPYIIST